MPGMRSVHSAEYKQFLVRLRQARKARKLSQEEVAEILGIPGPRVSRIETGQRRLDVWELSEFAKLYRKPLSYFIKP